MDCIKINSFLQINLIIWQMIVFQNYTDNGIFKNGGLLKRNGNSKAL